MTPEELDAIRQRHGDTSRELQELRAARGRDYGTVVHHDRGKLLAEIDRLEHALDDANDALSDPLACGLRFRAEHAEAEVDRLTDLVAIGAAAMEANIGLGRRVIELEAEQALLDEAVYAEDALGTTPYPVEYRMVRGRAVARHQARQFTGDTEGTQ